MNRKLHVLVVDDDEYWRHEVRRAVEGLGYAVSVAASAADAEALLSVRTIDLLITDNCMETREAGLDLLERLEGRNIPSILHTSYLSSFQRTRLREQLPRIVPVLKPIDQNYGTLREAVRHLLSS